MLNKVKSKVLNDELLNQVDEGLLGEISNLEQIKKGAFNIRKNRYLCKRKYQI